MSTTSRVLSRFALVVSVALILTACPSPGINPDPPGEDVTVILTIPVNDAIGVAVNSGISATFSAIMDPLTIGPTSFTLFSGGNQVSGTVECIGIAAIFMPSIDLAFDTSFTATITTAVRDLDGNAMVADKIWSFTTGAEADSTPPSVISTVPSDSAVGVAVAAAVTATFSEAMDPSTFNSATFTLSSGAGAASGAVACVGATATFDPDANLAYDTEYTASITTGVKDLAGNAQLLVTSWTFMTAVAPDTTAPTVTGVFPTNAATEVATTVNLTATFSEAVDPATVTGPAYAFTLEDTTDVVHVAVAGAVSLDGLTATFNPDSALIAGSEYTARISTALEDTSGNPLAAEYSWTFITAGLRPVMLESTGDFVMLATTGVTVGASETITGDIGLNALDTSFVGFDQILDVSGTFSRAASATITGNMYANNYTDPTPLYLTTAIADMNAAYADAAGRVGWTDLVSGELGGRTLAPGLYHCASAASITTNLILDGGPDGIYIFQIGGGLTMAAAVQVVLPNGALPKNVFWQTVGAVGLGASAQLQGIVLSNAAITLGASTVVNGRLFAPTIDISADSVSVLEPAP